MENLLSEIGKYYCSIAKEAITCLKKLYLDLDDGLLLAYEWVLMWPQVVFFGELHYNQVFLPLSGLALSTGERTWQWL